MTVSRGDVASGQCCAHGALQNSREIVSCVRSIGASDGPRPVAKCALLKRMSLIPGLFIPPYAMPATAPRAADLSILFLKFGFNVAAVALAVVPAIPQDSRTR